VGRPVRRPLKKNGLPLYIDQFFDRHGKLRTRFRRTGYPTAYVVSSFPSRAFWEEYDALVEGKPQPAGIERNDPGTLGDLVARFCAVPSRLGPSEDTRKRNRAMLEPFRTKYRAVPVEDVTFEQLDRIIASKAENAPWQAKKLRRLLGRLFAFAVKLRLIEFNPILDTEKITATTEGYHTWTEAEIEQFTAKHQLGSKAYLAMMLMLWTAQRRGDAIRMKPADVIDGQIQITQEKTGAKLSIRIVPQLQEAIDALGDIDPDKPYLLTEYGQPFTSNGFGNWFRARCDEAGLPQCSAHGLRKAASRRAAERGLSNQAIKSLTGHVTDSEVARYTRKASQASLADDAIGKLSDWDLANRNEGLDK